MSRRLSRGCGRSEIEQSGMAVVEDIRRKQNGGIDADYGSLQVIFWAPQTFAKVALATVLSL
jgi:hypothetical protein